MAKLEVRQNEESDQYELGFTEGDAFIVVQTIPGSDVRSRIEAAKAGADAADAAASTRK